MDEVVRRRIEMVYELVKRGSTEGERNAAKRVLDKLLRAHNLEDINLDELDKPLRKFKYTSQLEHWLFVRIVLHMIGEEPLDKAARYTYKEKAIGINLSHIDYVVVECSYEYFRRHMRQQWAKLCAPVLRKCRTTKARNKTRAKLQPAFFASYVALSKLCKEEELVQKDWQGMSEAELKRQRLLRGMEGGQYNQQMHSAHALEAGNQIEQP